ncbi:acyltransferase family protein [Massilia yuzhufengensis]|uniref:Peptidoglycan/LPS O-acetylase OafA/YrhL, contains acyltransferase and SGNH-hydrolase domains n=1 Tax=Massilia yuzhufengensis TaxID=1164594 RepID=A0A1I1GTG1_9BURK|nr:acyltransferase family protein [Massilia yuzhufengensis]SFC15099.1 Peptidoglycan/LPS O-acetylase OafA/YrhL, contains acyltransferase and SGNH-hydrolase domains [Massilia yuzhufengensis]
MTRDLPLPTTRLYFLDWVRILAFFALILYHTGMYYVSWDWHVKSPFAGTGPEPFMMMSSPWRLGLLFFIGGVAASLMLRRAGTAAFLGRRSIRLLVPLVFGMLVIVPPQPYFEVVEKLGYSDGYGAFMRLYLQAYNGFCREDCLILPTWNHLWFVAYLWIYTMLLGAGIALLGPRFDRIAARTGALLQGWKLVVLPAALLAAARIALVEHYPTNHSVVGDWTNHAMSFLPFVLGALVARVPGFWSRLAVLRWQALGVAAFGWTMFVMWDAVTHDVFTPAAVRVLRPFMVAAYAFMAWSAVVAACGFAQRHLDADGPARRYLNEAVFPVYILHQTLIVVLAHAMQPLRIAPGAEAVLLVVLTITLSFASFEVIRRVRVLRPLFGLAPQRPQGLKDAAQDGTGAGPVSSVRSSA